MTLAAAPFVFPNPVFEGSEKRLEVDFRASSAATNELGLRCLTRAQLDELTSLAACTIVASRQNEYMDAYVLSESSLFVYPTKWVLKTCGTTKLLKCVPRLLELAAELGLLPRRCKYSRASFLFPERQPSPHTNFDEETEFLRATFGSLGNECGYVLGCKFQPMQWHVYVADADGIIYSGRKPTHSMEVCMTDLCEKAAKQFFRADNFISAEHTTISTGIANLVPGAEIDDYVFDPCGYSMNGIFEDGFITIHVTPESGFSYASVELSGFGEGSFDTGEMLSKIMQIFQPESVSVALSADLSSRVLYSCGALSYIPEAYGMSGASCQELRCGGRVSYYTLETFDKCDRPDSPATVLRHVPSFATMTSSESDNDANSTEDVVVAEARRASSGVAAEL